jgi:hypothetical protein
MRFGFRWQARELAQQVQDLTAQVGKLIDRDNDTDSSLDMRPPCHPWHLV